MKTVPTDQQCRMYDNVNKPQHVGPPCTVELNYDHALHSPNQPNRFHGSEILCSLKKLNLRNLLLIQIHIFSITPSTSSNISES